MVTKIRPNDVKSFRHFSSRRAAISSPRERIAPLARWIRIQTNRPGDYNFHFTTENYPSMGGVVVHYAGVLVRIMLKGANT
jgi:hypothetical protein